jgi:predicted ATPase/DNA-binding winged helix-turn-helix (wHTH) protein
MEAGDQATVYAFGQWELDLGRGELLRGGAVVPIGSRAFAVLEVLARATGQLVSIDELMSTIWPGSIVADNTLQVHISAVRRALGADRGLLRTASGRGYRLLGPWLAKRDELRAGALVGHGPVLPLSRPAAGNLPLASSALIGREAAVRHVRDLLSAYRTVTLTGAGGAGKTRLALEVVRSALADFPDGGWLVELATVSTQDQVARAVVAALGLDWGGDDVSLGAVARAIGQRRLLLLLDNCEHVVEAAATLAEDIVSACPNVSILATSRELLRVQGEYTYRVPSLDLPPRSTADPGEVLQHSAVQLFIARMLGTDANLVPRREDLLPIAAICRRLDGMPLAIEFAAARAAALGVEQVLARLDDRFGVLTVGRRTALPRHQTLRATLDWSYELLPEAEQRLLRRVAVFSGGFTLDAAIAVMSDWDGAAASVVDGVANLVAKSLVVLEPGTSSRWRMLETTRSYALEKLAESGETAQAARRHAVFFRDLVAPVAGGLKGQPALERMAVYDNIRAALDWAFSADGDTEIGVALTTACGPVWIHFSLLAESPERIEYALKAINPGTNERARLRMQLLFSLGLMLIHKAEAAERTRSVLLEALAISEQLEDVDTQLQVLWALWIHHLNRAEPVAAEPFGKRFADVAQRSGDPGNLLVWERLLGNALHYSGDQPGARRQFEYVLAHYDTLEGQRNPMWSAQDQGLLSRARLARVLCLQGFVDQARQSAQACLDDAQAKDHTHAICFVLGEIVCPIALMIGDVGTAERSVATLIDLAARHGMTYWMRFARCHEGALLIKRGDVARGAHLLRSALAAFHATGQAIHELGFVGDLAESLAATGQQDEAHRIIDEALAGHDRDGPLGGRLWCIAELRRVKGEVLLQGPGEGAVGAAEAWFTRAASVAAGQGALFWELRAVLSLARSRGRAGRLEEARQILGPVYHRFTEGFDTADLRSARALLGLPQ